MSVKPQNLMYTILQGDPEDYSVNKGLITGETQSKALARLWVFVQ